MRRWAALALVLSACGSRSGDGSGGGGDAGARLEDAALTAGLVSDPDTVTLSGAYGRGTDRLCAIPRGNGHRIGLELSYGEGIGCSARGSATLAGETVRMSLDTPDGCSFEARLVDGVLSLPGALPAGCNALCDAPASLAGTTLDKLSDAVNEAQAMREQTGAPLCPA